jgi:hypothetical protein
MQTQYIHPSGRAGDERHDELIATVGKLVRDGIDVRLICSEFETPDWIEKLLDAGVDPAVLRIQPRVHNKGIVVDGEVADLFARLGASRQGEPCAGRPRLMPVARGARQASAPARVSRRPVTRTRNACARIDPIRALIGGCAQHRYE